MGTSLEKRRNRVYYELKYRPYTTNKRNEWSLEAYETKLPFYEWQHTSSGEQELIACSPAKTQRCFPVAATWPTILFTNYVKTRKMFRTRSSIEILFGLTRRDSATFEQGKTYPSPREYIWYDIFATTRPRGSWATCPSCKLSSVSPKLLLSDGSSLKWLL